MKTHLSPKGIWHCKSAVNPTKSIDNMRWNAIYNTTNWLTNILSGGNNKTTGKQ